jgi:hypothetical protein
MISPIEIKLDFMVHLQSKGFALANKRIFLFVQKKFHKNR